MIELMTTMRVLKEYIAKTLAWIRKEGGLKEWTIDKIYVRGMSASEKEETGHCHRLMSQYSSKIRLRELQFKYILMSSR